MVRGAPRGVWAGCASPLGTAGRAAGDGPADPRAPASVFGGAGVAPRAAAVAGVDGTPTLS